jgi:Galactose oxidase, central domain
MMRACWIEFEFFLVVMDTEQSCYSSGASQPGSGPLSQSQRSQSRSIGPPASVNGPPSQAQPPSAAQPATGSAPTPAPSQSRQVYPWSVRRLILPPPIIIPKPGVAPPTGPSPSPFPRYGHALPATGTSSGELFLFGGLVRETARNDLYLFSTRDLSATLLQTGGELPSPRVGHASALVSSVLIVWGGDTKTDPKSKPTDNQDDGLYLLNLGVYLILLESFRHQNWLIEVTNSFSRVDSCSSIWTISGGKVRACSHHGRVQIFCFRRPG